MAVIAILLGISAALVQATPSIVEVRTAAPNVIVVVVQTDVTYEYGTSSVPDNVDTAAGAGHWQVNGGSPTAIHRYSIPWDELPQVGADPVLPNWSYPVTTRHRIYLMLNSPLQDGTNYTISNPSYGTTNWTFRATNSFCESIKVNQVGYSKLNTSRFANFGVYMGNEGAGSISMQFNPLPTYKVYNEATGAILTNGTAVFVTNDTANANSGSSGEYVYRLSLNYVPEGGPYYVSVDGAGRSRSFGIGDNYSSNIAYVTMRGMFLHRCGMALTQPWTAFTHAICHTNIYDARSTRGDDDVFVQSGTPPLFMQGGYHDAGDMDQSAAHYQISILMLSFFDAFTNRFIDGQYNIPESGNGIPDFLDEIMWGVKVWEYLQITNSLDSKFGGVRAGWAPGYDYGNINSPHHYPKYGVNDAAYDTCTYGTFDVSVDCTAMVAGIFAHASRLIRPYDPAHANSLLAQAQWAWTYLTTHANVNEARTRYMYAALQLYLATGDPTYHNIFKAAANTVILKQGTQLANETYQPGNTTYTCQTPHFISYLLPNVPNADPTLVQNLKSNILWFANNGSDPNGPYMGPPPETQPYPQGVTKFMGWGAATAQGRYADVWMYATLFETDPVKLQNDINAVCQYADYSLGLNAMNMSYYTGLGTDQPNSPLDCNSYFTKYGQTDGVPLPGGTLDYHTNSAGLPIGNVPGICVYGPTDGNSGTDEQMAIWKKLSPAWDSLPAQRHYAQGWSLIFNNEFTVQETMAWNVPMFAFLYTPGGLPAPSNLSLTVASSSQINLSWSDNSGTEDGFKIERKTGVNGTYTEVHTVGANTTTFNDTGLAANTTYYYRVRAYQGTTNSPYSNEAHATTAIPVAPSSLTATPVSSSQINLGWTDNADNETGFKVERKTGAGGTYGEIATLAPNVTTYSDTGLAANTAYYYRVRAYNALGNSPYSNEANATTSSGGGSQDVVYVDDAVPTGATTGAENDTWAGAWVGSNPSPELGALSLQSANYSGEHQQFFYGASATLQINSGDTLYAWVYRDPNNPPTSLMLQWYDQSTGWEHRAYWGPDFFSGIGGTEGTPSKHQESTSLPGTAGTWVRLNIPASDVGLEGHTISGMAFTLFGGRAWWDNAGVSRAAPQDTVYVNDAVPTGATTGAENDTWAGAWVSSPRPELGTLCLQSSLSSGEHQQFFYNASSTLQINSGDTLYAYIYQDPGNPPLSVMLQWYDQSTGWEHRAYWGPDYFSGIGGTEGTPSKHQESTSPPSTLGSWLRLSLPASDVGLEGHAISGMAFTLFGGRAWWDNAGKSQ